MDENTEIMSYDVEEELEPLLPDGWTEGDDYFDSGSWTGSTEAESAAAEESAETGADESATENAEEETPATETQTDSELNTDSTEETPATETAQEKPAKFKVKFQFNHKEVEEEIDQADLPQIMQLARSAERYKARASQSEAAQGVHEKATVIAKILGYESPDALMDDVLKNARSTERESLIGKGNSEEIVDDFLERKYSKAKSSPEAESPKAAQPSAFAQQAKELLDAFPQLSGQKLPDGVIKAAAKGEATLLEAYRAHKAEADAAEMERIRKENQILRQNAASAKRAPVSGVSKGGSTNMRPDDDFLAGFNSDY